MRKSFAKLLTLTAAIAAVVAIPVVQAGAATNHVTNTTILSNTVETHGQVSIDAGIVHDKALGRGAALLFVKPGSAPDKLDVSAKVWYDAGTLRASGSVTFVVNPDGTVTFTGNAHYTGGSGKFRGVTGNLKINGTIATDGLATTHAKGNARY